MRFLSLPKLVLFTGLLMLSSVGCTEYHNCCEDAYTDPLYAAICTYININNDSDACTNSMFDTKCPSNLKQTTESTIQQTHERCDELFNDPNTIFDHLTYHYESYEDDTPDYCMAIFDNPLSTVGQLCVIQSLDRNAPAKDYYINLKNQYDYECQTETKNITDDAQRAAAIDACIVRKINPNN